MNKPKGNHFSVQRSAISDRTLLLFESFPVFACCSFSWK